jgi:hypothetical protein
LPQPGKLENALIYHVYRELPSSSFDTILFTYAYLHNPISPSMLNASQIYCSIAMQAKRFLLNHVLPFMASPIYQLPDILPEKFSNLEFK